MFAKSLAIVAAVAAVASAQDQFAITAPSSSTWWVAQSANVFSWTCRTNPPNNDYTVLIGNTDPTILVQPQAVISIQANADCSKEITRQQADFKPGQNYFLQLANPLNSTNVYAQSEPFEIRALGSAYPTTTVIPGGASPTGGASSAGTGTGTGSAAPAEQTNNGASSLSASLGVAGAAAAVFAFLA
ncbi:hypothetical protein ONZ45_g2926 [Pleurotus djamor]|nr:hypothetical protein ONZ45_g11913 [Pleurotus djamor]KAJ8520217.1 hypothetical protein ONZ45_g2926 [Pleurotus djamor]